MSRLLRLLPMAGLVISAACSGKVTAPDPIRFGTLRISLHGTPSAAVDEVWVTFDRIEARHETRGWVTVDERERSVNLQAFAAGASETLGLQKLPAGRYVELRLAVRGWAVLVDGAKLPLSVSGESPGVTLAADFEVSTCGVLEVALGWDVASQLQRSREEAYLLGPALAIDASADESGCCAGRVCAGGVCTVDGTCEAGGGEELIVQDRRPEWVSGYFGRDGVSIGFLSHETADSKQVVVTTATGEALIEVSWQGSTFRTSLFGGRVSTTVDLAILEESSRLGNVPPEEIPDSFSLAGAIVTTGDATLADSLVTQPEYELLPYLSRALGGAGLNGSDYPVTLAIHRMGMQAGLDLAIVPPPLPESSRRTTPGGAPDEAPGMCVDLRGDPNDDDCFGMCGYGCSCWEWVCGDCCCNAGCRTHDSSCRNCKWYKPWNCVLCATGLSFLAGLCNSCGGGGSPPYEPPCVGIGESCSGDFDCCGSHNGADEGYGPIGPTIVCEYDGAGNGRCRHEGILLPPACDDGLCEEPETCDTCPADCGGCPGGEYCGNGACAPGVEDNCTCPGDCPPVCGNGGCDCEETCASCAADCGECPPGEYCGDGACNGGESCASCSPDCGACPPSCGDGSCSGGETCSTCSDDCGPCAPFCGDGACAPVVEDNCNCPDDCPPVCGNGNCDCDETCSDCPGECGDCPPVCGDGVCTPVLEDCGNCIGDCPCWMEGTTCVAGQCVTYCGNGTCDADEWCDSCPGDCGGCCGNGSCDAGEDGCTCPLDCGPCSP